MTLQVPNRNAPLIDPDRTVASPWDSFFQQFVQAPPPFIDLLPLANNQLIYSVREQGNILVEGGTFTGAIITRGKKSINVGITRVIPVKIKDIISITFSVAPIQLVFSPDY